MAAPLAIQRIGFSRLQEWSRIAARLEQHAERRQLPYLGLILAFYAIAALASSAMKPLWYDELFTYYIAGMAGPADIWSGLRAGADIHPPLDYWIRHISMKAFGEGELAFRLPSVLAFAVALLCIFKFVSSRTSALYGFVALLVPFSSAAYEYSFEGRGYALLLAFTGLSLLCWQAAGSGRTWPAAGLAVSLLAAVYSHYYGALLFIVFAMAEVVRSFEQRTINRPIWAGIIIGGLFALSLLPLAYAARATSGEFWTPVGIREAVDIYPILFGRMLLPLVAVLPVLAIPSAGMAPVLSKRGPSFAEIAVATGLVLLPLMTYATAKIATGALLHRYAIPAVLGAGILVAFASFRILRSHTPGISLLTAAFATMFVLAGAAGYTQARQARAALQIGGVRKFVSQQTDPIVIGDMQKFFQLAHYSDSQLERQLTYLTDIDSSTRFKGVATGERLFQFLRRRAPFRIVDYEQFVQAQLSFLLILPGSNWQLKRLVEDGAELKLRGVFRGEPVYEVRIDPVQVR